jgi:hypothetical protein
MDKLLNKLRQDFPVFDFTLGDTFCWSPLTQQIFYKKSSSRKSLWAILHETAHAKLKHAGYSLDFELLQMEAAAWDEAKNLAERYELDINENHIQDCLDSYRDWLYKRSICPSCGTKSLQHDEAQNYSCFNCHTTWSVASSRFCRPYRQFMEQKESSTLAADDSFLYF